jgi:hypothetical protein
LLACAELDARDDNSPLAGPAIFLASPEAEARTLEARDWELLEEAVGWDSTAAFALPFPRLGNGRSMTDWQCGWVRARTPS